MAIRLKVCGQCGREHSALIPCRNVVWATPNVTQKPPPPKAATPNVTHKALPKTDASSDPKPISEVSRKARDARYRAKRKVERRDYMRDYMRKRRAEPKP